MKKIIILITLFLSSSAFSNGGSAGGPGPKPVKDAMILEFMNEYGNWEDVEIDLDNVSEILTQEDLIITRRDLRGLDLEGVRPIKILFKDGYLLNLNESER